MRRRQVLGACGLLLGLAGCGDDGEDGGQVGSELPRYTLTDLGRIGDLEVTVVARNDVGDSTGLALDTSGGRFAYAHVGGKVVNLSALYAGSVGPMAINARGWVVGRCVPDDPSDVIGTESERPFLYDGYTLRSLRAEIGEGGEAASINAAGLMVGRTNVILETEDNHADAFSYDGRTLRLLGHLGTGRWSYATAVDNVGRVTGSSLVQPDLGGPWPPSHAFLHDGHTMRDLGTFGGRNSAGLAIDAEAGVTGYAEGTDGLARAFRYDGTRTHDFGLFAGRSTTGLGIHRSGRIVGSAGQGDDRVALVSHDGGLHDLNDLVDAIGDWRLVEARSIDVGGRILALGRRGTHLGPALLTPI